MVAAVGNVKPSFSAFLFGDETRRGVAALVHKLSGEIAGRLGIDPDDVEQELLCDLLQHYPQFDPVKGAATTWSTWRSYAVATRLGRKRSPCVSLPRDRTGQVLDRRDAAAVDPTRSADFIEVLGAVAELPQRERVAVELHLGLGGSRPRTLDMCREALGGVTRERVRQLFNAGLERLRSRIAICTDQGRNSAKCTRPSTALQS